MLSRLSILQHASRFSRLATTASRYSKPSNIARSPFHSTPLRRVGLANILEDFDGPPPPIQVKRLTEDGIELMDGLLLPSSCVFLNGRVFLWDVPATRNASLSHWTKDMFALFEVGIPKPEILLLGTGSAPALLPPDIRQYLATTGISVETMDTRNACSTYNLLSEEGRNVAAALVFQKAPQWRPAA